MKKIVITQFSVLAFVSVVVTVLTFLTGGLVAHHWNELFYDGEAKAPAVTVFVSHYGYWVPLICCLSSIICIVVSIKRPGDMSPLWRLFTLIVTIELIGLALITLFYMVPAAKIMYRIM